MSKCKICTKSVYPMDPQINLDGSIFHKPCAKCADCNCQITISNFTKCDQEGKVLLLCKTHYFKRFKEGGSYVGGEKFQVKAARDVNATSRRSSVASNSGEPISQISNVAVNDESNAAAGSVKDRIASIRMNEKPKVDQPPSRRSSYDVSKSRSSESQTKISEPAVVLSPVAAVSPAPVSPSPEPLPTAPNVASAAPTVLFPPVDQAVSDALPVSSEVSTQEVSSSSSGFVSSQEEQISTSSSNPVEEAVIQESTDVNNISNEQTNEESVIDASPENGVSTPNVSSSAAEVDSDNTEKVVEMNAHEVESTSDNPSEESN